MTAALQKSPTLFALPGRKDEAWKYADRRALEAVQGLTPVILEPQSLDLKNDAREEQVLSSNNDTATHAQAQIHVGAGESATIIHILKGDGWLHMKLNMAVEGKLSHIIVQDRDVTAVTTAQMDVRVESGAQYDLHVYQAGSLYSRIGVDVQLLGETADFTLNDVQLGQDKQNLETVTKTTHAVPCTTCDQVVRNVLRAGATASYSGKIKVERGADQTDAEQNARSLLLDRTASANTKPELEIYADDVKCAHGATVGELDQKALFYLMARGLTPEDARALLIEAFIADVIAKMPDEAVRDDVLSRAQNWMKGGVS